MEKIPIVKKNVEGSESRESSEADLSARRRSLYFSFAEQIIAGEKIYADSTIDGLRECLSNLDESEPGAAEWKEQALHFIAELPAQEVRNCLARAKSLNAADTIEAQSWVDEAVRMYKRYETESGFSEDIKKELNAEIERVGVEVNKEQAESQNEQIDDALEKCPFITESIQAFADPSGERVPPFDFLEVVSFLARNTELIRPVRAFIVEAYANNPEAGKAFDSKLGWTMVQWLS